MALESFTWENNGILTLLNDEKTRACVFLLTASSDVNAEGICSVYEVRPEGCRKYPIVLNSNDNAILDDGSATGSSRFISSRHLWFGSDCSLRIE